MDLSKIIFPRNNYKTKNFYLYLIKSEKNFTVTKGNLAIPPRT